MLTEILSNIPVEKIILGIAVFIGATWTIFKGIKKYLLKGSKLAEKGAVIAKEISEALFATSDALKAADKVIKDDGSLEENSIEDAINAGKTVYIEFKDVIAEFKKKK